MRHLNDNFELPDDCQFFLLSSLWRNRQVGCESSFKAKTNNKLAASQCKKMNKMMNLTTLNFVKKKTTAVKSTFPSVVVLFFCICSICATAAFAQPLNTLPESDLPSDLETPASSSINPDLPQNKKPAIGSSSKLPEAASSTALKREVQTKAKPSIHGSTVQEDKGGFSFFNPLSAINPISKINPFEMLLEPVTKLQRQSLRLEQELVKLTTPVMELSPSLKSLEKKMNSLEGGMSEVKTNIKEIGTAITPMKSQLGNVHNTISSLHGSLKDMRTELKQTRGNITNVNANINSIRTALSDIRLEIKKVRSDINDVKAPIAQLKKPITALQEPIAQLKGPVTELLGPISELKSPLLRIEKPMTAVDARLASLDVQLTDLRKLIGMILTSIFVAAAVIAIGTPIAAVIIFRNQRKILKKPSEPSPPKIKAASR